MDDEYVSRKEVHDILVYALWGTGYQSDALLALDMCKSKDVEPVRYGHWDITYETCGIFETTRTYYYGVCSECGRRIQIDCIPYGYKESDMESVIKMVDKKFPYCHCGCKMIKEDKDADET